MKKLMWPMLLGTWALCTMPITYADTIQPSLENAHAFIKEMAEKGQLQGFDVGKVGKIKNIKSQDCVTSYNFIGEVVLPKEIVRHNLEYQILWDQVSVVELSSWSNPHHWQTFNKNLIKVNNQNRFYVDNSKTLAQRIIKAMDFIRQQCDTTKSKYGF
jgi:hypothetical protein